MIGLLGSLLGGRGGRMIGGMIGGRTGAMIGGLVGSMVGGRRLAGGLSGLGGMLSGSGNDDRAAVEGQPLTEADAELLIRAMANAAKADGGVDQEEIDGILGQLNDASDAEVEFLNRELHSPMVGASQFAAGVPRELAGEAYVVSATAIRIDTDAENEYLRELGDALGVDARTRDALHAELGIPSVE